VLAGYFDESGTSDSDTHVLIGGAIADTVLWSRIERRWRDKLSEYGLSMYHAVDAEWRNDEFERYQKPIRDALTNFFSKLLAEVQGQAFGSAINRATWRNYAPDKLKALCSNDPYFMAFELALQQISSWSEEFIGGEPVAIVFARQQQYQARAAEIHARYLAAQEKWPGIGSLTFAEPKQLIELQAADLLCYELQRFAKCSTEQRKTWTNLGEGTGQMAVSFMVYDEPESFDGVMDHIR
jgi:hypothetical protein